MINYFYSLSPFFLLFHSSIFNLPAFPFRVKLVPVSSDDWWRTGSHPWTGHRTASRTQLTWDACIWCEHTGVPVENQRTCKLHEKAAARFKLAPFLYCTLKTWTAAVPCHYFNSKQALFLLNTPCLHAGNLLKNICYLKSKGWRNTGK